MSSISIFLSQDLSTLCSFPAHGDAAPFKNSCIRIKSYYALASAHGRVTFFGGHFEYIWSIIGLNKKPPSPPDLS